MAQVTMDIAQTILDGTAADVQGQDAKLLWAGHLG